VDKPIYNHVTGLLDPPERIESPKVGAWSVCTLARWHAQSAAHTNQLRLCPAAVLTCIVSNAGVPCCAPLGMCSLPVLRARLTHRHLGPAMVLTHLPSCAQILIVEGLHPFYDEDVANLLDFKIYLDISDEIKFAWKIQRDMAERGGWVSGPRPGGRAVQRTPRGGGVHAACMHACMHARTPAATPS